MDGLSWDDFADHSIQSAARGLFVLLDAGGGDCVDFPAFLHLLVCANFLPPHCREALTALTELHHRFRTICAHGQHCTGGGKNGDPEVFDFGAFLEHLHSISIQPRPSQNDTLAMIGQSFYPCPRFNIRVFTSELLLQTIAAPIGLVRSMSRIWTHHRRRDAAFQHLLHDHGVAVQREDTSGHFSFDATIDHVYREVLFNPMRGTCDANVSAQLLAVATSPNCENLQEIMFALAMSPRNSKTSTSRSNNATTLSIEMDHATQLLNASRYELYHMLGCMCIFSLAVMAKSVDKGDHSVAAIPPVAAAIVFTHFIRVAHRAARLAMEPYHQGVILAQWLILRHRLSHIALDWSQTGVVRLRHLSAFELFERICEPLLQDDGGETTVLGVWMHMCVLAWSFVQTWMFFTSVAHTYRSLRWQFAVVVVGLQVATIAVVGVAYNIYIREASRVVVLQRLRGLTQIGNWGGGGEIALNVPGSKVNQTAWRKLVEAVFARIELGNARGMSRRDALVYILLTARIVAWSQLCVAVGIFFGAGRAVNLVARVPAAWALAVGVWVWTIERSVGHVDQLKADVLRLHSDGSGIVSRTASQQLSRDVALIVGAALAILLLYGEAGALAAGAEGTCSV